MAEPSRLNYTTEASNGWNSVWEKPEGRPNFGTRLHYVKTARLADEIAASLQNAFDRGVAYGHSRALAEVAEYASADFEGRDPAEVIADELAKRRLEV